MSRILKILPVLVIAILGINGLAQHKTVKADKTETQKPIDSTAAKKKIKTLLPDVYLGHSEFKGGFIKKNAFDSLMKQGLSAKDTFGNTYKVIGFNFTYAERQLYEDSVANLIVMTDYNFEYCPGDTLTTGVSETLYERTKPKDTIFINQVRLLKLIKATGMYAPDSMAIIGKPLKCIIAK